MKHYAIAVIIGIVVLLTSIGGRESYGQGSGQLQDQLTVNLGDDVKMEFVIIRPGDFTMGSKKGETDEKPTHQVTITKPFYMGKHEVTQEQWDAVMTRNPRLFSFSGATQSKSAKLLAKKPVVAVSWEECQVFLRKVQEKVPEHVFRLPREAEWEYACRAGSAAEYCYGDDAGGLGEYAWFDSNSDRKTHPVGEKKPNAWGLYDMHGNVWEWCEDWYGSYDSKAATDPVGLSSGSLRVLRGGSWDRSAANCRSSFRVNLEPSNRLIDSGLRVVVVAR